MTRKNKDEVKILREACSSLTVLVGQLEPDKFKARWLDRLLYDLYAVDKLCRHALAASEKRQ